MKNLAKSTIAAVLTLSMAAGLAGCGGTPAAESAGSAANEAEETEVIVFAAASMTETLEKIKETYEAEHEGVTMTFNFDSSGTLKTQIEEGADCDVFISAGQEQMNQLDIEADPAVNTDGLDFVESGSRIDLLENKVTLVVPDDNEKGIESRSSASFRSSKLSMPFSLSSGTTSVTLFSSRSMRLPLFTKSSPSMLTSGSASISS